MQPEAEPPPGLQGPAFRPRGFFQEYLSRLRTSLSPQQWDDFRALKTAKERLSFVGRLPGSADPQWPVDLSRGMKDAAGAKAFKDRGNQAFLKGDFKAALDLYTKCVLLTPYGDDLGTAEIAVATANRSAALYRLGKYRKALEDIDCALAMDFPKGLKHKVLDRKARCMLALSDRRKQNPEASRKARDGAMAALRETLTALDEATDLDAERRGMRETEVRMMLCMLTKAAEEAATAGRSAKGNRQQQQQQQQSQTRPPLPVDVDEEDDEEAGCGGHSGQLPAPTGGRHPLYPGASQLLSFARRGAVGRQAEAKAPISAGDILVSEKPWVFVLLREKAPTHCYQCAKPLLAPVPCPTCSSVSFCSTACRDLAVTSHHTTECSALALIWDSGVSLTCHLALRLITQRNIAFFRDLRENIEAAKQAVASAEGQSFPGEGGSPAEEKLFWAGELSAAQREYLSVLRMVTHEAERSVEDLFQRAVMATFLVKCLREWTEFFEEEESTAQQQSAAPEDATNGDALNDDDLLVGDLLMHHLQMMQFNAHEVFEVEMGSQAPNATTPAPSVAEMIVGEEEDIGAWRSVGLGGALYPSLVLFNHSCEPGVVRYFKGSSVVVRAIRGANVGEMVAENYGPIYTRQPRDRRQAHLRSTYWFNCECRPCKEDWPLFENMPTTASGSLRFRCHPAPAPAPTKASGPTKGAPASQQVAKRKGCSTGFVVVRTESLAPVMNCNDCGCTINVIKGLKMLSETDETYSKAEERLRALMEAERTSGVGQRPWRAKVLAALADFLTVLRSLEEVLAPPLRDFTLCQQSARRCMLALGNLRLCTPPAPQPPPALPTAPNGVGPS
ncbi:SET and MYND domain-containing protein 4-like [Ischnura elegans]|uniref:SET and MYND domain-containing protein 4-like n=1 Tax=Ischnura elegans TaxID=197161 RepID=UPI001ED8B6C8|nr:SET and MYND domain-containing protein 4-like [Ischnura elegans]